MGTRTKAVVVAVVFAILAFLFTPLAPLGSMVWPEPADLHPEPTPVQVGLFMFYTVISSAGFGIGVAFLLFGYPHVAEAFRSRIAPWVFVGVFWFLWSWWIHDIGHMTTHGHTAWLLVLEYGFHATSIVFASIIAYALVSGRRS